MPWVYVDRKLCFYGYKALKRSLFKRRFGEWFTRIFPLIPEIKIKN